MLGFAPKVHCSHVYRTNQQKFCYHIGQWQNFFLLYFLHLPISCPSSELVHIASFFSTSSSPHSAQVSHTCQLSFRRVSCHTGVCSTRPRAPNSTTEKSVVNVSRRESAAWKESGEWGLGKGERCPGCGGGRRDLLRSSSQRNCSYHLPSCYQTVTINRCCG